MAIIEPEGLFSGERLAACSDLAQLYWPRFYIGSNGFARLELSYLSIISKIFQNFEKPPESKKLWEIFCEYEANYLAILYEVKGVWWCEFATSEKFLPRYKTRRDLDSPSPDLETREKFLSGYISWKSSKSFNPQSFQKSSESFCRRGVGVGVGEGVGVGVGESTLSSPSAHRDESREKEIIESVFGFYLAKLERDPKKYLLTEERRKKAQLRFRERSKANGGNEAAVEMEFSVAIENLAADDFCVSGGYIDWTAQIFKSQEEFEKRLNKKPKGGRNGKTNGHNESADDVLRRLEAQAGPDSSSGKDAVRDTRQTREPAADGLVEPGATGLPW